jgi:hypothetical protein
MTEMAAVPEAAIREAGTAAASAVVETKVVEREEPFQRTVEPESKAVPVTARVKAGPPVTAEGGERDVMAGRGDGV